MESFGGNHKGKLEQPQVLVQSQDPSRCAVCYLVQAYHYGMENKCVFYSVDTRTAISFTFQKNTSGTAIKTKTSGTTTAVQLNQFGFKTWVNKVEANTIVRNSYLPPVCMEKTKENDRQTPQGVWINRRSICQI